MRKRRKFSGLFKKVDRLPFPADIPRRISEKRANALDLPLVFPAGAFGNKAPF
jgi:hypothetical protein